MRESPGKGPKSQYFQKARRRHVCVSNRKYAYTTEERTLQGDQKTLPMACRKRLEAMSYTEILPHSIPFQVHLESIRFYDPDRSKRTPQLDVEIFSSVFPHWELRAKVFH